MKIAQQALMSHDQWRECVQKCCGVIEHGIDPVEMCGLSGSYTRVTLLVRPYRESDPTLCDLFCELVRRSSYGACILPLLAKCAGK